jgi:hypothetical protein
MARYRFHPDGALFFVTFSVAEWLPVFVSEPACRIVSMRRGRETRAERCHRGKGLRTNAYVIMPAHFHGIFFHSTFEAKTLEYNLR